MTEIIKKDGRTIIKTGKRIDTLTAVAFEKEIEPVLQEPAINLEMDCGELTYMASSGLRIIQKAMRQVMMKKGHFKITKFLNFFEKHN